jgi:hypothetical protein
MVLVALVLTFSFGCFHPLAAEERVTLLDGTVMTGELLRMSGDTLYFKTAFIDELPIARSMILSIEFSRKSGSETSGASVSSGYQAAPGMGELMLIITGPELVTTIRFRRGEDRSTAIEANKITLRISANERTVYEKVDDEMDEEINSEGWTILKNKFPFGRYEVPLPAGEYLVSVFVGNDFSNEYRAKFDAGSVGLSESKEKVKVFQDGVTTLVLKSSQPFLSLGKYDLKWVD